ncbi:hypothetical protein BDP27DRAFT_1400658 [Rhodocollybia butyracea]|uniref:Uncharacterized protein n=1 Tax=Rhodocollybia butyracea TaxID=206335 RepID=A0A9P5UB49_9AGAR|nr:hypothetical protein BDP27DRAFT_1400658 [Rhodocollybia butyracea]
MLITPHIHYFGLVFLAVLIPTHAMPVDLVHSRPSSPKPGSAKRVKTEPVPTDGFNGIEHIDFKSIANPDSLPTIESRTQKSISQIVNGVFGVPPPPKKPFHYINRSVKDQKPPAKAKAVSISVVEGLDENAPCRILPCIVWRRVDEKTKEGYSSVYQIDPKLEDGPLERINQDTRVPALQEKYEKEFWELFPRRKFEQAWIEHQKAIGSGSAPSAQPAQPAQPPLAQPLPARPPSPAQPPTSASVPKGMGYLLG